MGSKKVEFGILDPEAQKGTWSHEYDMHLNDQAVSAITFAMKKAFVDEDDFASQEIIHRLANNLRELIFRLSEDGLVVMNPAQKIYKQSLLPILDIGVSNNKEDKNNA